MISLSFNDRYTIISSHFSYLLYFHQTLMFNDDCIVDKNVCIPKTFNKILFLSKKYRITIQTHST